MGRMKLYGQELHDCFDKFLTEFLELAAKEEISEGKKRSDGYAIGYMLTECMIKNQRIIDNNAKDTITPLLDMGFVQNIAKGCFEENINKIKFVDNILFLVKNFKKQESGCDYYAKNLKTNSTKFMGDYFKSDMVDGKLKLEVIKVEKVRKTVSFEVSNAKSGFDGKVVLIHVDDELDEIKFYCKGDEVFGIRRTPKDYIMSDDKKEIKETIYFDEVTINHFKHVANINSFFIVVDQAVYGIEETLQEEDKK